MKMVKEDLEKLVDGEPLSEDQVPKLPSYSYNVVPNVGFEFAPPTQEEIKELVGEESSELLNSYCGRVERVSRDIVYVTLVDTTNQYYETECDKRCFDPDTPRPGMYFVLGTFVRKNSSGLTEHVTKVRVHVLTKIPLTQEESDSIDRMLEESRERALKYK